MKPYVILQYEIYLVTVLDNCHLQNAPNAAKIYETILNLRPNNCEILNSKV